MTTKNRWQVILQQRSKKVLRRVPKDLRERIRHVIDQLAADPYPTGCKKLSGYENLYRLRVGEWRVIYSVENEQLIVLVIEIAPRSGAYRNL